MGSRRISELTNDQGTAELYLSDSVQETYIDGAWGIAVLKSGIVKLNLFTVAPPDNPKTERRDVAIRLIMPTNTLFELRNYLQQQCDKLIAEGLVEFVEDKPKPSSKGS